MDILDQYMRSAPTKQNALDIFKGEWASRLPKRFSKLEAGKIPLFEDPRILWGIEQLGGVKGKTVLELGPLEAGHTYILESLGARAIAAVEANTRAYLKCLVIKEILGLRRATFLCGDAVEYMRQQSGKFDMCVASGILYHMVNPVETLALAAQRSDRLLLWTHYYAPEMFEIHPELAVRFPCSVETEHCGFPHTLYRQEYAHALESNNFFGGEKPYSHWMNREDILRCLRHFGFDRIEIEFEDPEHVNGPNFTVIAERSPSPTAWLNPIKPFVRKVLGRS